MNFFVVYNTCVSTCFSHEDRPDGVDEVCLSVVGLEVKGEKGGEEEGGVEGR